jgi:hypothetical protein
LLSTGDSTGSGSGSGKTAVVVVGGMGRSSSSSSGSSGSTPFRPVLAAFEGRDRARVRAFMATASLGYAADGLFALGLSSLDDLNNHPMYLTDNTLVSAGVSKASHRRRFQQLVAESLGEWTSGHRAAEAERSREKRIALCMTGQVRSFEEVAGNLRDMVVKPLQQLVDLPGSPGHRKAGKTVNANATGSQQHEAGVASGWSSGSSRVPPGDAASASNVHVYATLVLKDSLEGKGFRCTKTTHSRHQVAETLASLGAPVFGFVEDDEASRSGGSADGCKAWPGFVQAHQMQQCWALATATEQRQGWRYDYAVRVRPDVAYKRSFRLAHWPLFAPLLQVVALPPRLHLNPLSKRCRPY